MTRQEQMRFQSAFLNRLGHNARTFLAALGISSELATYVKDAAGRIVTLNRRNCDICNFRDEWDAVGRTSAELFPMSAAEAYAALDRRVLATGRPLINQICRFPADRSRSYEIDNVYPLFDCEGQIIGTLCTYRLVSDDGNDEPLRKQLKVAAHRLETELTAPPTITDLAKSVNRSKAKFIRDFTNAFGLTPWRYLMTRRLDKARELLERTQLPIAEIAAVVGFYDQSHFCRAFAAARGQTPSTYRLHHSLKATGAGRRVCAIPSR